MKISQCRRLQYYLEANGSITPLDSWVKLGIYRIGARVWDLKRRPFFLNIQTKIVKVHNHFGEPCRVAQYSLIKPEVTMDKTV